MNEYKNSHDQTVREVLEKIGQACRNARINASVSMLGLSSYLQVDKSTLSRFEHGQINSLWLLCCYSTLMGKHVFAALMRDAGEYIWEAENNGNDSRFTQN